MNQKVLHRFDGRWQAEMIARELEKAGIQSSISERPREYTAIVLGSNTKSADLSVAQADFIHANQIFEAFNRTSDADPEARPQPRNFFRRVVLWSCVAIVFLPVVFNGAATMNYLEMRRGHSSKQKIALIILLLGWVIALVEVYLIFKPKGFN